MNEQRKQPGGWYWLRSGLGAVHRALVPRACSAIVFGALFCNLSAKLYHAEHCGLLREYVGWILTDITVLLTVDVLLTLMCYRWPKRWVLRTALSIAAVICTWSVVNAAWLIRTGTQILPMELLPLVREPINISLLVLRNLIRMPGAAAALLIPSGVALAFFFSVLASPVLPDLKRGPLVRRITITLAVAVVALLGHVSISLLGSNWITARGLRYNCQSRAILVFILPGYRHLDREDFSNATRVLPRAKDMEIRFKPQRINHNVVVVVLEGVQYGCTSLAMPYAEGDDQTYDPTPYLASLAQQGVTFTDTRSVVTHTTKAIFGLLTGQPPSACQDIGETVPVEDPYVSLATILSQGAGYRTAFFQSAKGTFESRPGLIHNLGFETFRTREDLEDPNSFLGYLGADEFALLEPIEQWIQSDDGPFFLTVLCSATHDPYEVPIWYADLAETPAERYQQTITYTDQFLAALDVQLANLGLSENTILCVVGDHGEGFGEHRIQGHERIAYDEVLRIVMCMRAPHLIEPGQRITSPVSSVDLTPTILSALGFDIGTFDFAGTDILQPLPDDRKVYFAGWMHQGPSGYVQDDNKYVYDPEQGTVTLYRLKSDPLELSGVELPESMAQSIREEIIQWRRNTIFRLDQPEKGQMTLFDRWSLKWNTRKRESKVKRIEVD